MHTGKQNSHIAEMSSFNLMSHISQKKREFEQTDSLMQEAFTRVFTSKREHSGQLKPAPFRGES